MVKLLYVLCLSFVIHSFVRTYSIAQGVPPKRALLAPAIPISPVRIASAAGVDHDYARVAIASIIDTFGRRVSSGASLRLPFGKVGSLVAKGRTLSFAFGGWFRRPTANPLEDEYSAQVRRILGGLEAKARVSTSPAPERPTPSQPCHSPDLPRRARTVVPVAGVEEETMVVAGGSYCSARSSVSSRRVRGSLPPAQSSHSCPASGGRPITEGGSKGREGGREGDNGAGSSDISTHRKVAVGESSHRVPNHAPAHGEFEAPGSGCGSRFGSMKAREGIQAGIGPEMGAETATKANTDEVDISPRAAKKVLPHFLAIGNPGSQALVPKEGADIVQRQALARFYDKRAAHEALNDREVKDMRRRQVLKWKEYEKRQVEEKQRLRDYLHDVKEQAEAQRVAIEQQKVGDFLADNPDPNRAYPCRIEYDTVKENEWRRAWCNDLETQVALKRRLEREAKRTEASRDRVRASQLEAAIKADRCQELLVRRQDRARIHSAWESQMAANAHPEGAKRTQTVLLDKIVR